MPAAYLNNAATSWPKAPGVEEAVRRSLSLPPADGARGPGADRNDPVRACRRAAAALLGVSDESRVVLTSGATAALNLAIRGFGLKRGDLVVTTVAEHNSVIRPLEHLKREKGIKILYIGLGFDGRVDIVEYGSAIRQKPRLVVLTHASNVTGAIFDLPNLLSMARDNGAATLVDASQTAGYVPLDRLHPLADLIAFTGHKALHGPAGTGGLYVARRLELRPLVTGGTGVSSDLLTQPRQMPMSLEAGTANYPGLAGLAAALEWSEAHGPEACRLAREASRALADGLRRIPGVTLYLPREPDPATPVVSFRLREWPASEAGYALGTFGLHCRTGLHCAPLIHRAIGSLPDGTIRFSPSGFTRPGEIDIALEAVRSIAR